MKHVQKPLKDARATRLQPLPPSSEKRSLLLAIADQWNTIVTQAQKSLLRPDEQVLTLFGNLTERVSVHDGGVHRL